MSINFERLRAFFAKVGMLFGSLLGLLALFFFPGTGAQLFLLSLAMVVFANSFAERARISWRAKKIYNSSGKRVLYTLAGLNIALIVELLFLVLVHSLLIIALIMLIIVAESIGLAAFLLSTTFGSFRNQVLLKAATLVEVKPPPLFAVHRGTKSSLIFGGTVGASASVGYWLFSYALVTSLVLFFIVFGLVSLIIFFFYRLMSLKFEFYWDRFRAVQAGTVRLEKGYSDIANVELRSSRGFRSQILIYGKQSEAMSGSRGIGILAVIPSNPKKQVLGNIRLYEWLKSQIGGG